jgi:hypothetical protein
MSDGDHEKRVAVGRGFRRDIGADDAAGAGTIIDKNLLAELLTELVGDDAPDRVIAAAGWKRNDQADAAGRVVVGGGRSGESRQRKHQP